MIEQLEAAIKVYTARLEECVTRAAENSDGDTLNPGLIAGLYADLEKMTTDLYRRRQHAGTLRRIDESAEQ